MIGLKECAAVASATALLLLPAAPKTAGATAAQTHEAKAPAIICAGASEFDRALTLSGVTSLTTRSVLIRVTPMSGASTNEETLPVTVSIETVDATEKPVTRELRGMIDWSRNELRLDSGCK